MPDSSKTKNSATSTLMSGTYLVIT